MLNLKLYICRFQTCGPNMDEFSSWVLCWRTGQAYPMLLMESPWKYYLVRRSALLVVQAQGNPHCFLPYFAWWS